MSDASNNPTPNEPAAPTLNYANRVGEYPEPDSHPGIVVFLIGITSLAGIWAVILGCMCLGDIWLFSVFLVLTGVALAWATLGKLTAKNVRPLAATILLVVAMLLGTPTGILSHVLLVEQERKYGSQLQLSPNEPVFRLPTNAERQVYTYEMIRASAAVSVCLAGTIVVYLGVRYRFRRKG